ncbi:MAG TPA: HEAT repeat domain-containing protein [Vicinamibacterales bacterium]|nr:HEAT repeat domain-containing protein [Vicinamibacterales bacterium]
MSSTDRRATSFVCAAFLLGGLAAGGPLRDVWVPIARAIGLEAEMTPASANVLSEHELDDLDEMTPQNQAELLLDRSINHYRGANEAIAARVKRWRGRIELDQRLNKLFVTAINSDDLTVRTAGIEVDIAARNLVKDASTVDRLEATALEAEHGPRVNAMWDLALIGNRGVERDRVFDILMAALHDDNQSIRYWAVEGLAYLATDSAIEPLLDMFHDDPSPTVRERAARGLAQSGMFSADQRRTAIPRLLDFAGDGALDAQTHSWAFQALRDITGETLPHDALAWREWYGAWRRR